jgi:3',5'-cyclic AMP phosphodiesterase CpdA
MTARVFHLSDLHMGHGEAWEPLAALLELIDSLSPELLIVTGDVAHRGRRAELEAAKALLDGLERPVLVVPGNHDIPYTFPGRFTRTFDEWNRVFGSTQPTYAGERVAVWGLNSVRAWRQQGGALDTHPLLEVTSRIAEAPASVLKVVALHHHLAAPPWRAARKRPLSRRDDVLRSLSIAGADLVVSGHVHQASIAERREFKALEAGSTSSLVLATAAALGRPRPRRREEARGLNVYEAGDGTLAVLTFAWDGTRFEEIGRRVFARDSSFEAGA